MSAEELQVESDLRARLNELLVLTKEGTVDAVTGLGGLLTRDSDPGGGGGLQAGEQRVRAHRQSVYGLTREPPPWAMQPGTPTTSAKIASFTKRVQQIRKSSKLTAEDVVGGRQLHSKVAIVTGANCGIGYETARVLCKAGARVILACRNVKAAEAAADKIRKDLEGAAATAVEIVHDSEWVGANYVDIGTVEVMELDLADLESVRSFAAKFLAEECPLHYLICNAAKMAPPFRQTKQGYETQWGINHLGHFLLSTLLTEKLDETAARTEDGSRLVVLTSQSHQFGRMHWDKNFLNAQEDYDPWAAYFQTKLANVLFVREFDRLAAQRSAKKHGGGGTWPRTTAHAVNPGLTNTSITRELSSFAKAAYFGGLARRSAAVGAATTVYCCLSKTPDIVQGGRYYENCEEVLLWDDLEAEDEDDMKAEGSSVDLQNSIGETDDDESLKSDVEDETSLEAAARLWALSEWMVQPNSTYHDAHNGLFSVYEAQEDECFEKVFDYQVETPSNINEDGDSGELNSAAAIGEAAGEWQEAQFDPTEARRVASQAAAARQAKFGQGGSSGSSGLPWENQVLTDDGVELAELSPADTGRTPRRAAVVHTPVIEPIDPFARRMVAGVETNAKSSTVVEAVLDVSAASPPKAIERPASNISPSDEDQGRNQSQSLEPDASRLSTEAAPAIQPQPEIHSQRMAWSALTDEERAAAVALGWDSDGVSWEHGERPAASNRTPEQGYETSDGSDETVAVKPSVREWRKLSPAEQAAGLALGFTQDSWDQEMAPEVAEAKAKAKAAADEAVELAMLARAAKEEAEKAREVRRAEAAKKEQARAARKAKVAAAKAQRKALKNAEEQERLAADAARKARDKQEAENAQLKAAKKPSQPQGRTSPSTASDNSEAHPVVVDQADAEGKQAQRQKPTKKDKLNKQEDQNQTSSADTQKIGQLDGDAETAEAAVEAQAKAAFAALAAAVAAGPRSDGDGQSDAPGSDGTPVRTPGHSGRAGSPESASSPSGSPADEKKQAVVTAKADYFFGQAMKLHDEFAAIEKRSGAKKLSCVAGAGAFSMTALHQRQSWYFEASALAEDLGLSLSGPALNAAIPKLDPGRSGDIRFADFEEWWKAASLQAGSGGENTGKKSTGAGSGAKSGASKNSLGSAIALALAEEGGFVE